MQFTNLSEDMIKQLHMLVGPSTAGQCRWRREAGYSTHMLVILVRDQQMLQLEEAIRRLTSFRRKRLAYRYEARLLRDDL
jgi:hypothetical protein